MLIFVVASASACGVGQPISRTTGASAAQALSGTAEWLEFEPVSVRQEVFRDLVRQSQLQAGQRGAVFFPMLVDGEFVAARALDSRQDLLLSPDAGTGFELHFEARGERFSEERRDALQGLSEREAAELIARSLLHHWGLEVSEPLLVARAAGAPYAAAFIDGELRINPSFVYLAASAGSF
jgi:hypothetical protein